MATTRKADIGIIGGSGLYKMEGLQNVREVRPTTPFGRPSDALVLGTLHGRGVAFLSRHGRHHRISPTAINYRANIYALKSVGVTRVFSVSAVGSMREMIKPGELVLPNQFIDRTRHRADTFFDQGVVAHVAFADPTCPTLFRVLDKAAQNVGVMVHQGGTYVCIEGPQFSTKAESRLYRQWGVDVIGMTNLPEAKLAREAEMCYATLALVTDYDCWHESEDVVSVGAILDIMQNNVILAKRVLGESIQMVTEPGSCECGQALDHALVTPVQAIPRSIPPRFRLLLSRRLGTSRKRS